MLVAQSDLACCLHAGEHFVERGSLHQQLLLYSPKGRKGMKLSILPGTTTDGHAMCRPAPSREASRHAVSYTGTKAYLHVAAEMSL